MKLSPGDYFFPDDERNAARAAARDLFLSFVEELAPEVLEDLRSLLPKPGKRKTFEALQNELPKWAEKYHLDFNWLLNRALNTLLMWSVGEQVGGWGGGLVVCLGAVPEIKTFSFEAEEWDPAQKNWKEYEDYLNVKFKRMKATYRDQVEARAEEHELLKTPEVRNREHFAWLVRFQVQGWKYREIADNYPLPTGEVLTEDMIGKGIKRAARLAGISLRQAKKSGRPRKYPN